MPLAVFVYRCGPLKLTHQRQTGSYAMWFGQFKKQLELAASLSSATQDPLLAVADASASRLASTVTDLGNCTCEI